MGNKLVTKKLITKTNSLPRWAERVSSCSMHVFLISGIITVFSPGRGLAGFPQKKIEMAHQKPRRCALRAQEQVV